MCSVTFSVDDGGSVFLVVLLGDPRGREGGERSEGRSSLPDSVLSVGGSDNSDLGTGRSSGDKLLLESVGHTFVHGGTTGHDDVLAEFSSDINVGGRDGSPGEGINRFARHTVKVRLVDEFGGTDSDGSGDSDDSLIGKGVLLVLLGVLGALLLLCCVVLGNVTELFLDLSDDFELGSRGEVVTSFEEEFLEVSSEDTSGNLHTLNGVREGESFEDGDGMGNTITGVGDETGGSTGRVEGHDGLDGDIDVLDLEGLEHDLDHLLSVGLGVTGGLGEEDTLGFVGGDSEFVVEGVVPDLLHVFPGFDDTGSDGVVDVTDTLLGHGFVTDVLGFVLDSLHLLEGGLWSTDGGGEDSLGGFLSGETGLHHTRSAPTP
jgi:hypothetical protein